MARIFGTRYRTINRTLRLGPSNGSRLSCGRTARRRAQTPPGRGPRPALKRNSTLLGGARQLQAPVRRRAGVQSGV
jgi:hypothetical protein